MKISKQAIDALRNNRRAKTRLAYEMDKSVHTIELWLTQDKNDNLTKALALEIIKEETGLTHEQILDAETAQVGSTAAKV